MRELAAAADVLFGVSAAFAVTAAVLLAFTELEEGGETDAAEPEALLLEPRLWLSPGSYGVGLGGRF